MYKEWPPLLRLLSDELGYTVHRNKATLGYDLFSVDLSSWKLRLSNRTPVIWVKHADLAAAPQHLVQSLADVLRERSLSRQIVLVLLDGDSRPLLRHTSSPVYNLVIIGAEEQEQVLGFAAAQRRALGPDLGPDSDLQPGALRDAGAGHRQPVLWPRVRDFAHHGQSRHQPCHPGHPAHWQNVAAARGGAHPERGARSCPRGVPGMQRPALEHRRLYPRGGAQAQPPGAAAPAPAKVRLFLPRLSGADEPAPTRARSSFSWTRWTTW